MVLKRVLSIQSHVVSGYVGNKSATFPLQVLGFDVDAINSVQLSNHTGYKCFKGQVLLAKELEVLFDGLKENDIHFYSHLLTGYCGDPTFLKGISEVFKQLKTKNKDLIYVCDPVMGDNGKFYVPQELLPIYRDEIVPFADVLTPNQFEAELLTGITIKTELDAFKAMKLLHDKGPEIVVLTSSAFENQPNLVLMASSKKDLTRYLRMEIPRLDAIFTGTGDLFASMLLAWLYEHPDDLKLSCEKTLSAIQEILKKTLNSAKELCGVDNKPNAFQVELRLVQSLDIIRSPSNGFTATMVEV